MTAENRDFDIQYSTNTISIMQNKIPSMMAIKNTLDSNYKKQTLNIFGNAKPKYNKKSTTEIIFDNGNRKYLNNQKYKGKP